MAKALAIDVTLSFYVTLIVLTIALVVGIAWLHRVWSDVKGEAVESPATPDDLLGPLTQAFAAGQMSKEEYLRIKESIRRGGPAVPDPKTAPAGKDLPPSEAPV